MPASIGAVVVLRGFTEETPKLIIGMTNILPKKS